MDRRLPAGATLALTALALPAAAQVRMTELATIDLDSTASSANPEFIGSNPSAIAWDGVSLYVAGFNGGAQQDVAIVQVLDPLGTPSYGVRFGVIDTPGSRGYSGLDVLGGTIAAAHDDGSTTNPNGIVAYDLAGNQLWTRAARGGSGVGFDPGFPGGDATLGAGVGWTQFGSGRRALQDAATGANIWDLTNGMIINGAGTGTFWRDMGFDDATGDVWLREGNNLIRAPRTGDNAVATAILVVDEPEADSVALQNVAYLDNAVGDLVIYNDRETTGLGQSFFDAVKVVLPDGTAQGVDWGGFAPSTGSGAYDFSWDAASGTLAILDFNNRNAHLFRLSFELAGEVSCAGDGGSAPCPCGNTGGADSGCANSSGAGAALAVSGDSSVSVDDAVFSASGLPGPGATSVLVVSGGLRPAPTPFNDGLLCLTQPFARLDVAFPDAAGVATWGPGLGAIGLWGGGDTRHFQTWYRDPAGPCGTTSNLTNALSVTFTP